MALDEFIACATSGGRGYAIFAQMTYTTKPELDACILVQLAALDYSGAHPSAYEYG
jgi:hypothetical protein